MFRFALVRRSNMYAVGRLISQGVYTVAGPFHPFGGAVDIIVVQQQDGSYKSSPWYVKFGKFQGVLKRSEKVVNIAVNDEALKFHMFLDSTGEAYFLKDSEPDKEPSSSHLAITSGHEVLALEDCRSKLGNVLESKVSEEDVEKGESSDERDNNLALRFEGRKASYLLMQQAAEAQAAKARAAEESEFEEVKDEAEFPESSTFKEDTDIKGNAEFLENITRDEYTDVVTNTKLLASIARNEYTVVQNDGELPKSITLQEDTDTPGESELLENSTLKDDHGTVRGASNDLLSSVGALKLKISSIDEIEIATGGSALHSLLSRSVGLEGQQKAGRPSCSLVAQAALAAVAKAAWEPGIKDSFKGLGNDSGDSFEIVNNSGEVIVEGFRLRKSKSLNLRSGEIADEPVCVQRARSEPDLRLPENDFERIKSEANLRHREIGDNPPELSTLTITSADGVVVLHTPRRGSPPTSTSRDDHIQTLQQPIIFEGDGLEKPVVLGMLSFGQVVTDNTQGDTPAGGLNSSPDKKEVGALITAGSGGWKLWPFPLRRSKTPEMIGSTPVISREALMAAASAGMDSALVNKLVSEGDYYLRSRKNKVRSFLPSSQMLSSLNLKEGSNRITFTFFTRVLGKQQVDARIYLWKWNTRVVISDVDGTITKSDVLGQVMPLMGRDWTQSGVTRLFSAIKENGYEVMFLSARAISQAYLTRQFLFNLKQDGEALPDGPVVISPDGLFPSLYREVIRRAPHEFKIACLQDIRDLFPEDCNPFYAGFGNRDTDEISYLKVGIPKGKIFIINPKGEVAVNNRVDVKSYTSLHKLVDDMFPPQTYTEQEDFNSWNYWKMPLPDIEDELSFARFSVFIFPALLITLCDIHLKCPVLFK
ncbi:hypothetical protein KC19_VG265400 [Ceratodon purpureus]|uniref:LNS2/PITP domain-containing protein n=1 Tax=Ceratodon purpureus TaxID=3225 RepID=A0A8T0HU43_CERPU|nr:hypothetical protein KC19_VG265400 [Ceratodon purpureus]KAG0574484.1 hypothetical protein KC19_VG265400 [Ceratodon purpureus]